MIRVNDTEWPLLVLSIGPDNLDVAAAQLPVFSRLCLAEPRAITAVVHGRGTRAVASLDLLVGWIRQFELVITAHARGIAWAIEDETLRAVVSALLRVQDDFAFGCASRVFGTAAQARLWLDSLLDPQPVPKPQPRQG